MKQLYVCVAEIFIDLREVTLVLMASILSQRKKWLDKLDAAGT